MLTSTSFCKKGSLSDKLVSLLFVGLACCMPVPQKLSSCVCDLLSVQHTCLHDQEQRWLQMLHMYMHWLFVDNLKHIKYHTLQTLASRIPQKHLFLVSSEMPQSKWTVDISYPTSHGKENSWVFFTWRTWRISSVNSQHPEWLEEHKNHILPDLNWP